MGPQRSATKNCQPASSKQKKGGRRKQRAGGIANGAWAPPLFLPSRRRSRQAPTPTRRFPPAPRCSYSRAPLAASRPCAFAPAGQDFDPEETPRKGLEKLLVLLTSLLPPNCSWSMPGSRSCHVATPSEKSSEVNARRHTHPPPCLVTIAHPPAPLSRMVINL